MSQPVVIVTGASRGLGAAAARIAAEMGAAVVINARSADDLAAVAGEIESAGGRVLVVPGDVSQPAVCERIVAQAVDAFGRLDAVINNAGVLGPIAPLAEADADAWQRNWAINVLGPVMLTQAALPHLRQSGGRIVNVSSGAAVRGLPGWGAYCLSKAAINSLTRVTAAEEPDVIAVAVRPGVIDTEMQRMIREEGAEGMPAADHQSFVQRYEQGELLPPEAPGRALALLALYAPPELSGEFVEWDADAVQALGEKHR